LIERYSRPEMRSIWDTEAKTQRWLDVEIAVCEGLAHFGKIPAEDVAKIKANACFELERMDELEKETRHDVMAFVKNVQEHLGRKVASFILGSHRMTWSTPPSLFCFATLSI